MGHARSTRATRAIGILLVTLVVATALPALRVGAVPRYAARYEQN